MRILELRVKNFLSHEDTTVDFTIADRFAVVGQNGAGKSAIVEGVYYALTGKMYRTPSLDDSIMMGESYHQVTIVFEHNGVIYSVTRGYDKHKEPKKAISVKHRNADGSGDWEIIPPRSLKHDWNILEHMFGMDADFIRNTTVVCQNDITGINNLTPMERRRLFINMLFSGKKIGRIVTEVKKSIKAINKRNSELVAQKVAVEKDILPNENEAQLSNENDELEEMIRLYESLLVKFNNRVRTEIISRMFKEAGIKPNNEFASLVQEYQNRYRRAIVSFKRRLEKARINDLSRLESLRGEYSSLLPEVKKIERVEAEVQRLRPRVDINELKSRRDNLIALKSNYQRILSDEYDLAVGDKCPICDRPVGRDEREHIAEYRAEVEAKLQSTEEEIQQLETKIENESERSIQYMRKVDQLNYLKKQKEKFERVKEAGQSIKAALDDRPQYSTDFYKKSELPRMLGTKEFRQALNAYTLYVRILHRVPDFSFEDVNSVNAETFDADIESGDINAEAPKTRKELEDAISDMRNQFAANKYVLQKSDASKPLLRAIKEEMKSLKERYDIDKLLLDVLSIEHGAPAMALDEVLLEISDITTKVAGELDSNVVSVDFVSHKSNKDGKEKATLEIKVTRRNGVVAYDLLSGGEKVKISFAIRVALSLILLKGKKIEFFILDEAMSALDSTSRSKMVNMLTNEMNIPQIIVITHIDEIANQYPHVLSVYKNEHSVIEWVK